MKSNNFAINYKPMKKLFISFALFCLSQANAQVGINTDSAHPSAALEIAHPSKDQKGGLLIPTVYLKNRTDGAQTSEMPATGDIKGPAKGLVVYHFDDGRPNSRRSMVDGLYVNLGEPESPNWSLMSFPYSPHTTFIQMTYGTNDRETLYDKGSGLVTGDGYCFGGDDFRITPPYRGAFNYMLEVRLESDSSEAGHYILESTIHEYDGNNANPGGTPVQRVTALPFYREDRLPGFVNTTSILMPFDPIYAKSNFKVCIKIKEIYPQRDILNNVKISRFGLTASRVETVGAFSD